MYVCLPHVTEILKGREQVLFIFVFTIPGTGPGTKWALNNYLWNELTAILGVAFQILLDCS